MRSSSHLVASSGFSVCSIIVTVLLLLYFFFTLNPFISFSFLIVVASTSKNMMNKIGNSKHSCLIHVVKGSAFSVSLLSMMLAVFDRYSLNYVEVGSICADFPKGFYQKWHLNFVRTFSASLDDHMVFSLQCVIVV